MDQVWHILASGPSRGAELVFLKDLAVTMIVAGLVTVVFHQLRQPVVLGYILAGVIIGPFTPPFPLITNRDNIELLAELGLIFLMFSLGLHFSLRKLAQVGATALIAAVLEIVLMIWIGYEIGRLFGWSAMDSIFLGAILSISSTTIIIKALADLGKTKESFAQIIFGILIVEDILAIAIIALLSSIAVKGTVEVGHVPVVLGKLGVFLVAVLVAGLLAVPRLLRYVARFRSDEMLLITVLGLCFGVSLLAVQLEYSVALGAFLIGAIVAEARESGRIGVLIEPIRDMFSAVFFVAIGMMINPGMLIEHWLPALVITAAVVVGKVIACSIGTLVAGHDLRTSLRVGMGLAQIGEFSFIIAQLGTDTGRTSEFIYPIAVAVSALTTLLTPYLIRAADPLTGLIDRKAPAGINNYLDVYHQWIGRLSSARGGQREQIRAMLRKWAFQIGLNIALMTAMLVTASFLSRRTSQWLPELPIWTGGARTLWWLAAMMCALPLLVATLRKLRATAMVLSELSVPGSRTREATLAKRAVVVNAIVILGSVAMCLWMLLLSSTMLPPLPMLIAMLLLIALVTGVMWSTLVKMYARAQIALRESLSTPADEMPPPPDAGPKQTILSDAALRTVVLSETSPAAGNLIRELELRSRTGASVVGIQRNGANIVNPGPDEELRAGDRVLLLGTGEQLASASEMLRGGGGRGGGGGGGDGSKSKGTTP